MSSKLYRIDAHDLVKGVVTAVLTAVVAYLGTILNVPGFDLMTFDWAALLNVALAAGAGYVLKNFLSDEDGRVGGVL